MPIKWLEDEDSLINLNHVKMIKIINNEDDDDDSYIVSAFFEFGDEEGRCLYVGNYEECILYLDKLSSECECIKIDM